jgi:hypothetical protein
MERRGFLGLLGAAIAAPFVRDRVPYRQWARRGLVSGLDLAKAADVTAFVQANAVFLQAHRFTRDDIARAFNVPARLVGKTSHYIVTPQGLDL